MISFVCFTWLVLNELCQSISHFYGVLYLVSFSLWFFLFCLFCSITCLSREDHSGQRRALRYISRRAPANSLFTTHMTTYGKSPSIATQKTVSAMATIIFSKRVGNIVSGVVVWPNQLSRKVSVRHNQRYANTHIWCNQNAVNLEWKLIIFFFPGEIWLQ